MTLNQAYPELHQAFKKGMALSILSTQKAERADPTFSTRAKEVILRHLRAVGQASGEELVELCKSYGVVPENDDRAFGTVFRTLKKSTQIEAIRSDLPRRKGHGTNGGALYGIGPGDLPVFLRKQAA